MIDWERVCELHEQIGKEAFPEVLTLFTSEVAEGLERLENAREAREVSAEFHFLKGAALNLGLEEMVRCCADGENNALRGQDITNELEAALEGFPRACKELLAQWQARLHA